MSQPQEMGPEAKAMSKTSAVHSRISAAVCLILMAGCAGQASVGPSPTVDGAPETGRIELAGIPFVSRNEQHCGPATLAMNLAAVGVTGDVAALSDLTFTPPTGGGLPAGILAAVREKGRLPIRVHGLDQGLAALRDGTPVLLQQAFDHDTAPPCQYALLIGYDPASDSATLRSASARRLVVPAETLRRAAARIPNWGLFIADPNTPPPQWAGYENWFSETMALEQAGWKAPAIKGYRGAIRRWPDRAGPWLALAKIRLEEGNLASAEANLRAALDLETDNGTARNRLARVLLKAGRLDQARAEAMKAVDIGDPYAKAARETLRDIERAETEEKSRETGTIRAVPIGPAPSGPRTVPLPKGTAPTTRG